MIKISEYDLIIFGAGTSGLPTARLAGMRKDKKILLLDDGPLGGKCVNTGCTPSKALVYCIKLYKEALKSRDFGTKIESIKIDFNSVLNYAKKIVATSLKQNETRIYNFENIELKRVRGKFINESEIEAGGETFSAPAILIATGTTPFIPPIKGIENISYLTNENVFNLDELPKSIGLIGGGFISCEFASIFNSLGSNVTIFEFAPTLIPRADKSIIQALEQYFKEDGIQILTNTAVNSVAQENDVIQVETKDGDLYEVEKLMVNTGFKPNTKELNLLSAKVETTPRGYVKVNEYLQTSNEKVWAIGDVVGKQQFTHMALRESKAVVSNIFDNARISLSFENIPYAVFTDPPIGSVGKTEQELQDSGIKYKTAETELPMSSRGFIMGLKRGIIKLFHNDKKIFGCHIIGEEADTLIHEIVPLVNMINGMQIFRTIIHAHPALPEVFNNLQS